MGWSLEGLVQHAEGVLSPAMRASLERLRAEVVTCYQGLHGGLAERLASLHEELVEGVKSIEGALSNPGVTHDAFGEPMMTPAADAGQGEAAPESSPSEGPISYLEIGVKPDGEPGEATEKSEDPEPPKAA